MPDGGVVFSAAMPMVPRIAALLLLVPLACDRADGGDQAQAQAQALQTAAEELGAARAAFEADRTAMQQELAALRKAVDGLDAKLDALTAEQGRPVQPHEPLVPPDRSLLLTPLPDAEEPLMSEEDPRSLLAPAIAAGVACESETRCTIDQVFIDTALANPASLTKQARIVPAVRDGVTTGYKLYGIRPGSLPKALGLKNGDLVLSVNGHPLASMDEAMKLYTTLRRAKRFDVGIERKGTPFTLTIEIVDAPKKP